MKRCPSCEKTFDDSYRFCQIDGTPLVDDTPLIDETPLDPYATIVAVPRESTASAIGEPEDVLELADEGDPLKTMYVSDDEMQQVFAADESADEPLMNISPIETAEAPEPPKFIEPDLPAPSFGDMSPPPSPFSAEESVHEEPAAEPEEPTDDPFGETTPPIPSPFDAMPSAASEPSAETPQFDEPEPAPFEPPAFKEPEPVAAPIMSTPFDQASAPVEWTPPPAPDASWQNQEIGSNTPFQPPPAGTSGKNQTLPIISLILGIVSLCCYISPVTGIAALITGFLGMKNANNDPDNYGGKGLAIAGMIIGGIFLLVGVAIYVIYILIWAGMIGASVLQGF